MVGRTISHYTILEKLGEGGMGVVYKARDTKLDRLVALKFLPAHLSASEQDKVRFMQEAKAASSMNHPNICTIYSVDEYDGQLFIAMELVEGQTLQERKHPFSTKQAIDIGVQIAEGLAAAHEKGIVHRDIKPENIMVRRDGIVQIMDFGLAKLRESTGVSRLTKEGSTVGTIGYMSPEQVQGLDVDHRSDLFSLGVVLYEIFTGQLPFKGVHETALMYEIVNVDVSPPSTVKEDFPPELDEIVLGCLEKDRDERRQSAKELAKDLRKIKGSATHPKSKSFAANTATNGRLDTKGVLRLRYLPWAITALCIGAVLYLQFGRIAASPPGFKRFEQLTEQSGEELFPDVSPDGNYISYTKTVNGIHHIFLQRIGGGNVIDLTRDSKADDYASSFSPNGELLVFRSDRDGGGIFLMGSTGESVRRLTNFGYNPAWSPDGTKIIFATESVELPYSRTSNSQLWTAEIGNGKIQKIHDGDAVQASWSPNGKWIAFWGLPNGSGRRVVQIISASGGNPTAITDDNNINWSPFWSVDGKYLYFSSSRGGSMNLWRVRIDESSGEISSQFEPVVTPSLSSVMATFSKDGQKLIFVAQDNRANIYRIKFDQVNEKVVGEPEAVTEGSKQFIYPSVSPNKNQIAFTSYGQQEDVYIINTDGSGLLKLTNDIYKDRWPYWSPDGRNLVFFSDRSGKYEVWEINIDGSNLRKLTNVQGSVSDPMWSPDGKAILFCSQGNDNITRNYVLHMDTAKSKNPEALPDYNEKGRSFYGTSISPNGKFSAGAITINESGNYDGLCIYSIDKRTYTRVSNEGIGPRWLNDNKRILYAAGNKFYILNTITGNRRLIFSLKEVISSESHFTISPDNKWIYYIKQDNESDIWMGYLK